MRIRRQQIIRSHGNGCLSATTQVKVLSPEIIHIAMGQGFLFLEANINILANGESVSDMPGSKSVAGKRTVYVGTWENRSIPMKPPKSRRDDAEV